MTRWWARRWSTPRSTTRPTSCARLFVPLPASRAEGGSLKDALDACRAECDAKFSSYAIYEHCLPFNVARAYDEALGVDTPRIWTAERDRRMWEELQG